MRDPSTTRTAAAATGGRSHARIEESVTRLESVIACHIIAGPGYRLESLHVIPVPEWPEETVRRDVQALLLQRFDLDVPPSLIRIGAPDDIDGPEAAPTMGATTPGSGAAGRRTSGGAAEPHSTPAAGAAGKGRTTTIERERLVLDTVHLALRSQGTSVGVDLLDGEQRRRGTAGPVVATGVLAGVVEATIDALGDRITHTLSAVVAEVIDAGGDQIAIATITASDGRSRQRLTGSAIVRGNIEDAMARATLDATNRLLVD